MRGLKDRDAGATVRRTLLAFVLPVGVLIAIYGARTIRGDEAAPNPTATFRQYCFQCHGKSLATAGISLEELTSQTSIGESFQKWEKVATVLEQNQMPPKGLPQPSEEQRRQAVAWIRSEMRSFARKHDGEPGRVTVRRLTSGEYDYAIQDLTGYDLDTGIDATTDSVGGEGFTNFGDVQFMQDANLERYLEAAKGIAAHAVIGAGPVEFYSDPGKSGFEMSAIARIRQIYNANGFRTVSGEGGVPFGLEKYGKAFYVAWRYRNRAELNEPKATLAELAAREGITPRFAQHIWGVLNRNSLGFPVSDVAARWKKLPAPAADAKSDAAVRASCEEIQKFVVTWPSWLFSRGDVAAGGAGDESPLVINERSLKVEGVHHFVFNAGGRGGRGRGPATGPTKVYINVSAVNPTPNSNPVVIWKNPTVAMRAGGGRGRGGTPAPAAGAQPAGAQAQPPAAQPVAPPPPPPPPVGNQDGVALVARNLPPAGPRVPLRTIVNEETAKKLDFGKSPDGSTIGPDDFASGSSVSFEVPVPEGFFGFEFRADAVLGRDRDQVFRITISDRPDGARGIPIRAILGDPESAGYKTFKSGVLELAALMPPNSHNEPTPADKDPIPLPFDSTYNVPEHDEFDTVVKYVRDDKFVYESMLDEASKARVDNAWNDLYASFAYHDNYLRMLAQHYKVDLKGKHVAELTKADIDLFPVEGRQYVTPLRPEYEAVMRAQAAGRRTHLDDCLRFASRAWRRPLTEKEKQGLRAFYDKTMTAEPDHVKAIRALIARILVAPAFLYRVELPDTAAVKPLNDWEMASRLSFFLWSSIPDDELRRAAAAGELSNPQLLQRQVKRMLADAKARRLSTEFFGQWLGFYHFDQHRGVDTGRFPEFTDQVKQAMYDESVSFFEYVIRKDRPVREMLSADYTFLNKPLAKYYGINKEIKSSDKLELVEGANAFQRGGLLRLGAILTAFSAPLRTSPVKRGDWVLRRILGTPVPPPPADAGSIPADDKLFGGLSVKARLEAHKRNATCANCHMRIDPLGFALEHYDSTGRWRDKYPDGKPIEDSAALSDHTEIAGVSGLLDYLHARDAQVRRTLSAKLIGYALGRTVQASDQALIDRMLGFGDSAGFSQLAAEIVTSAQFRNRLGREETPRPPAVKSAATRAAVTNPRATTTSNKVGER